MKDCFRAPRPLRLRLRCQREKRCRSKVRHKCRPYHRPGSLAPGGQDCGRCPLRVQVPQTCFRLPHCLVAIFRADRDGVIPIPSALPGLTWFDLVWLGGARLDADASCLREIHLAPEPPFQAPPRHIPGPGGTKLCSPAPILRANCLIINNGRCQVNFTKRCMRVHSENAHITGTLSSCRRLHHENAHITGMLSLRRHFHRENAHITDVLSSCRHFHRENAHITGTLPSCRRLHHTVALITQALTSHSRLLYGGDRCCRRVKTDIISESIVTFCENRRRSVSRLRVQPQCK